MRYYFHKQQKLLKAILIGEKFDRVVEFHTVGSTVGLQLASYWGANLAVIFDSPTAEQFYEMHGTRSIWWRKIVQAEKLTMEAANKIMVYSEACESYLKRRYTITGNLNILPCQIVKSKPVLKVETDTFNIGFIGSFLSWHKLELCVRVFCKLHERHSDTRLILIGYGQEWKRIRKMVNNCGKSEFIRMTGFVTEEELEQFKGQFSIAVMTGSNWYGSPLKLFEYAWAKIPFIAPVSETIASIFTNREHCLYIRKDDEELSFLEALEELYRDKALRNKLAENAYNYVLNEFGESAYVKKLVNYLAH